jgi:EmrB/QacA subfamily drug resistance transporter
VAAGPGPAEIVGAAFAFDSSEHDFCVPSVTVRTPAASATPAPRGGGHWALVTLCTILFLTFLDNTVVSVALADIQSSLHAGVTSLQWVVNGYALTFASLMLAGGRLGDQYGRKRVMLGGVLVFCAGSVVCALATSSTMLIAGRVVMGVGAAASEPGTLSVIRHVYPERRARARALGAWAAVAALALALGPVVGGALVGLAGWREIFWFNLAFGALAVVAAAVTLPEHADPRPGRLDLRGFLLGAVALAAAIFAVIDGEQRGYTTWWILALFAFAVLAGALFVRTERRSESPVLDLRFFRNPTFSGANTVAFATYFGVFAIFFFVALYLQVIAGFGGYRTAEQFLPMTAVMILASAGAGPWVARIGPRLPMTLGCLCAGAGILLTGAVLGPHVGYLPLAGSLVLVGLGFGLAVVPVTSSVLTVVPARRSGMAASATNTSRELGAVFGVAVLGAVVNSQLTADLTHRLQVLGIPASFQAIVIDAVEHGGLPSGGTGGAAAASANPAAAGHAGLVQQVIDAAYSAFYSGLDIALLLSGALVLAAAVIAWFCVGREPADLEELPDDVDEADGYAPTG